MPPKPLILAFDTSAAHCAVALLWGEEILAEVIEPMAKGQAERLLPLLEEVLQGAGKSWQDLTALAVCTGPGNFTGVRIGVAAARGLALSLGIPAIGVTGLEAMAPRTGTAWVSINARRDQVFVQQFQDGTAVAAPVTISQADLADTTGDAAVIGFGGDDQSVQPNAVAKHAARQLTTGQSLSRPTPFYIRAADAAPSAMPKIVILDDA